MDFLVGATPQKGGGGGQSEADSEAPPDGLSVESCSCLPGSGESAPSVLCTSDPIRLFQLSDINTLLMGSGSASG